MPTHGTPTQKNVNIETEEETISITDDGHGMTEEEINKKYLMVGYKRREQGEKTITPKHGRPVMGRKGVGKLSLFAIAGVVEVHSVKDGKKAGCRLKLKRHSQKIKR